MAAIDKDELVHRLSTRLKMRHLVLLLQIGQYGSLTRVAQEMATSQPAITKALSEMETMFGATLFDRSMRGMAPTALGQVTLNWARSMINDLGHLAEDISAVAAGHAAHVHVGITPFISGRTVSAAVQRTLVDGRRLTVTLHEGTNSQLMQALRDHQVDVVIGRAGASLDTAQIVFDVLYHQHPRLIANRRLAAQLSRQNLDWSGLSDLDWILGPPGTSLREEISEMFLRTGAAPPRPVVETYSTKLIGEMIVSSERAISVVPVDIAEELVRVAGVSIVPYSFDWTLPPIAMFRRSQGTPRAAESYFCTSLSAVCKELALS